MLDSKPVPSSVLLPLLLSSVLGCVTTSNLGREIPSEAARPQASGTPEGFSLEGVSDTVWDALGPKERQAWLDRSVQQTRFDLTVHLWRPLALAASL